MADWKRPESIPFPTVWRKFEGKRIINGEKQKFWVQDVTEDYFDAVVELMASVFFRDEPLCKYSRCDDLGTIADFKELWYGILKQRLALICLTTNENGETKIVGANLTARTFKGEKTDISQYKGTSSKKIMATLMYVEHSVDIFAKLNINEYLVAMGLVVLPEFRGEGIAVEIVKARRDISLAAGLKVSATVFTSIISQKTALKAGYKELFEISYDDLEKVNPEFSYPGISEFTKSIKFMYLRFDE